MAFKKAVTMTRKEGKKREKKKMVWRHYDSFGYEYKRNICDNT